MGIEIYKGMSKEQFLGNPTIIPDPNHLRLFEVDGMKDESLVPFLEKYTARINEKGVMVYSGAKLIAAYRRNKSGSTSSLIVDPNFHKQGIATEMIYQFCAKGYIPDGMKPIHISLTVQKVCEAVWNRIQKELAQ